MFFNKKHSKVRTLSITAIGFFLFSLPGNAAERPRDAIITASIAEPSNLIPFLATDSASAEISRLIFNGLLKYDKNFNLTGDLAEGWEVLNNNKTILFRLRKDVCWQDGRPFTSADVEFTYSKIMDKNIPTPYRGSFDKVKSVRCPDIQTVEVEYTEAFSPGLSSWTMGIVPRHLLERENLSATTFSKHPVGTGPFKLRKWARGQQIELESNPSYYAGPPLLARVVYRVIPDQSSLFLELETGGLDLVGLTPLQFKKQTDSNFFRKNYRKYKYPSQSYTYLGFNLNQGLLREKKVRQAIDMAINKPEIIEGVLLGAGSVARGPFLPGTWADDAGCQTSAYNPSMAKAILSDLGWKDDNGDAYIEKDGKRFTLTLITNQGHEDRKRVCEIIQKDLKDIGIEVKILVVEWGSLIREYVNKKNFDALLIGWHLSPDPDVYDLFHSSKTAPGEFNFISYANPEVDRLLEQGRSEFDLNKRAEIYHKVQKIILDDRPYIFLFVPESLVMMHKRFKGVAPAPAGIAYNLEEWYVNRGEEKYRL